MPALFAAMAIAALALTGCGGNGETTARASAASAAFPATAGSVTLETKPVKIVSLSPTVTEMLFAIGAGSQVTAVDKLSNEPASAPKTDLSGFKPNAEAIAAKNPDLVVLSSDTNKILDQLATLKIPVYFAPSAKTLDDTYTQINDLGKLTGHADEAEGLVKSMQDGIAAIVQSAKPGTRKLTYFHELDPTLYSATSRTFIGSVYSMLGLVNVADPADTAGGGYPQMSSEALIKANPDMIFLADTKCCQQSAATVKARPGFADVTAVKNNQIVELDDDIASRWGPRVVDLLRAVADAVAKVPTA
ncbi:MAG: ABC transporter substrate-binding protein [Dactylosporangium sp.]|nr:ABC transporter substrate-binding protein [Dactylosporangium sp.]NNJ61542.1 ABC transporter substrate-binding protein [Dactylosporangium sp.]